MRYQRAETPLRLDGLSAAQSFFAGCFAQGDPAREELWVAHTDERARCIHVSRHPGNETGGSFPLKAIIADAVMHSSSGIVLAHNHPSGDPRPSDLDCHCTRQLAIAAEALDCAILDHLVFAADQCTSFRRMGLL